MTPDDLDLVGPARIAEDLKADAELVRPEVGDGVERHRVGPTGQQAAGRSHAGFRRQLPMLDAESSSRPS